jgi:hypothetical protein
LTVFQIYGRNDKHFESKLNLELSFEIRKRDLQMLTSEPDYFFRKQVSIAQNYAAASALLHGSFPGETGQQKYYPLPLRK